MAVKGDCAEEVEGVEAEGADEAEGGETWRADSIVVVVVVDERPKLLRAIRGVGMLKEEEIKVVVDAPSSQSTGSGKLASRNVDQGSRALPAGEGRG